MKKLSILFAIMCMILVVSFVFVSCNDEDETDTSTQTNTQSQFENQDHTHDLIYHEAVSATCEKKGNIGYYFCSLCDKCFSDELGSIELSLDTIEIPVIECIYKDEYSTDAENHWYETVCVHSKIKDKNSHNFDEGIVTTHSTCMEQGVKTFTCGECRYQKTAVLPLSEEHIYQTSYTQDELHHWRAPSCSHSEFIKEKKIHTFDDDLKCVTCGYQTEYSTTGLQYTLTDDETGYEVSISSKFEGKYCIIPSEYNGLPVVNFSMSNQSVIAIILPQNITLGNLLPTFAQAYSLEEITFYSRNASLSKQFNCFESSSYTGDAKFISATYRNSYGYSTATFCDSLRKISVKFGELPEGTFSGMATLKEIVLPKNITKIEPYTFENCSSLETLIIPDGVTEIGEYAFKNCSSLKEIVIPNSVKTISANAFSGCSSLEKIEIPDSVTTIGEFAFLNCSDLTSVTIGEGTNVIGRGILNGCSSLEKITVSDSNAVFKAVDDCLIQNKKIIAGANNSTIPNDGFVTVIGEYAFAGLSRLKSIVIPDTVTTIEKGAFQNCENLESVTIGKGVSQIENSAFRSSENVKFTLSMENNYYYVNGASLVKKSNNVSLSTDELYIREGEFIYFGEYPQTIKAENVTISGSADSNGYFLGSDGGKYAKVICTNVNGYEFSNGTESIAETIYYFKVEPIKWRIISEENGKAKLLCSVALDNSIYCEEKSGTFAQYAISEVRSWLNETFYNTAFTKLQQSLIVKTFCDNGPRSGDADKFYNGTDTYDYVFLPSVYDLCDIAGVTSLSQYGVSLKEPRVFAFVTDYCAALMPLVYDICDANYLLRTTTAWAYNTMFCYDRWEIQYYLGHCDSFFNVVPCLWITL